MDTSLPTSDHFLLEAVADGIYAAIATPGKGAQGNTAIIDLGDRTVIFDTTLTPQAARDLRAAAEQLTGRVATLVVNSHWHGDHVHGNQVFLPEANIIATGKTCEAMATRTAEAIAHDQQRAPAALTEMEAKLTQATDAAEQADLTGQLAKMRAYVAGLPELRLCLPTEIFTERRVIQGSRRQMEIITLGGGHTVSDAFVWLPDDAIIVAGDLLFAHSHPWMGHGDPDEWMRILAQMERFPVAHVVPGHGPVGTLHDFALLRDYIRAIQQLVTTAHASGVTLDDAKQLRMPAPFDDWDDTGTIEWDVEFLWNRLKGQAG